MEILISTNIDSFIVVVVNVVTWALKNCCLGMCSDNRISEK